MSNSTITKLASGLTIAALFLVPLASSAKTAAAGTSRTAVADEVTAAKIAAVAGRRTFTGTVSSISGPIISINLNGNQYQNFAVDTSDTAVTRNGVKVDADNIRLYDRLTVTGRLDGGVIIASSIKDTSRIVTKTVKAKKTVKKSKVTKAKR